MDEDSNDYRIKFLLEHIPIEIALKFQQLNTHRERFILFLEYVLGYAEDWADVECNKKGSEHSIKLREDGNKSFMNSQYERAVLEYTESILFAVDASEELALAYANRSAALFKMGKYKDCLKDIDRALNLSYPDRLKTKLYKRQGTCLTELESPEGPIGFPAPEILQRNPDIPCASDAITVEYLEEYDRHIVATSRIRPGEVLVVEKQFCRRLCPQYLHKKCSECMRDSYSMIPCSFCVYAAYCSETCKEKACDEYHEVECPVMGLVLSLDIGDAICLGLRMAIVATKKGQQLDMLKQEVTIADANTDPATNGYCLDGKIHSDHFLSIHRNFPRGHVDRFSTDVQIRGLISMAVAVTFLAKKSKIFGEKLALDTLTKNPDVTFIGGLIFKQIHLTQPWTHRLRTNKGNVPLTPSQAKHDYGHALMAVSTLFNHACDANTIQKMQSDRMITIAAHPIEEGEQVLANYGLDYAMLTKAQRMEYFESWKFKCYCLACTQDWPLAYGLPSYKNQPMNQQNMKKIDTAVQKFIKCKFGTPQDRLRTVNELANLIETLFAFVAKPCKEMALTNQLMKLSH